MTSKIQALIASITAGFFGLCAVIAGMPGTLQDQIAQPFPEKYRGYISVGFAIAAYVARTYGTWHAAKSGPSTPPVNSPTA